MKLLENAEAVETDDFYNDLMEGYIKPHALLELADAGKVIEALAVIRDFESALESKDLIEYM